MKLTWGEGAALVAGGSGGIGSAIVRTLASAQVPVAFTYNRGKTAAERLVEELDGETPVRAWHWGESDSEAAAHVSSEVSEAFGPLRYFVASSGVGQDSAFHRLADEEWRRLIDTDLTAVVALTRSLITPMMKSGGGRVIFIGSVAGRMGLSGLTVYSAAKAALEGLSRALARETGPFGVTVNCVAPGFVETSMIAETPERVRKEWIRRTPAGRLGRPADVATMVGYLLSDQAEWVTGQTFVVDGGLSV